MFAWRTRATHEVSQVLGLKDLDSLVLEYVGPFHGEVRHQLPDDASGNSQADILVHPGGSLSRLVGDRWLHWRRSGTLVVRTLRPQAALCDHFVLDGGQLWRLADDCWQGPRTLARPLRAGLCVPRGVTVRHTLCALDAQRLLLLTARRAWLYDWSSATARELARPGSGARCWLFALPAQEQAVLLCEQAEACVSVRLWRYESGQENELARFRQERAAQQVHVACADGRLVLFELGAAGLWLADRLADQPRFQFVQLRWCNGLEATRARGDAWSLARPGDVRLKAGHFFSNGHLVLLAELEHELSLLAFLDTDLLRVSFWARTTLRAVGVLPDDRLVGLVPSGKLFVIE